MPPGLAPVSNLYTDAETSRHAEVRRGTNQIMTATGVCDLRSIVAVRRASHPVPTHMHDQKEQAHDDDTTWFGIWENPSEQRHEHDECDEGGDVGLDKFGDRTKMRIRRSFELLLNTGNVVRFEVIGPFLMNLSRPQAQITCPLGSFLSGGAGVGSTTARLDILLENPASYRCKGRDRTCSGSSASFNTTHPCTSRRRKRTTRTTCRHISAVRSYEFHVQLVYSGRLYAREQRWSVVREERTSWAIQVWTVNTYFRMTLIFVQDMCSSSWSQVILSASALGPSLPYTQPFRRRSTCWMHMFALDTSLL